MGPVDAALIVGHAPLPTRRRRAYRMSMATVRKRWTIEDVLALPEDGRRYELIDGVLIVNGVEIPSGDLADATRDVTPSPTWGHQRVAGSLHRLLDAYLEANRLGEVLFAPADIALSPDGIVQPDLFVVPLVGGRPACDWVEAGRLLLAIEILSPSSAPTDRVRKRRLYQRAGVPEYWIADPNGRVIERWRPDDERPEVLDERIEWCPDPATSPLTIDLAALFADALDR